MTSPSGLWLAFSFIPSMSLRGEKEWLFISKCPLCLVWLVSVRHLWALPSPPSFNSSFSSNKFSGRYLSYRAPWWVFILNLFAPPPIVLVLISLLKCWWWLSYFLGSNPRIIWFWSYCLSPDVSYFPFTPLLTILMDLFIIMASSWSRRNSLSNSWIGDTPLTICCYRLLVLWAVFSNFGGFPKS